MRIAVFGLGYVGSVSAACLAAAGHEILGVDVDPRKLAAIRGGRSPVTEPGLDNLLGVMVDAGRVTVTDDPGAARGSDLSLVCVGTPSRRGGSLDTTFLERAMSQIGAAIAGTRDYHVVVVRSTVLPGVLQSRLIPILENASAGRAGADFGVCVNPEFLREGSAIRDFEHPPFTLIGETDARAGDRALAAYDHLRAPVYRVLPDEAAMVKYASNIFHAVKVAFANEIGALCHELGADGQRVMQVFCEDRELNISPRYLRPGFAFGGSCLPKDLRAMAYAAKEHNVAAPLVTSILASNDAHIERVIDTVLQMGRPRVALLGLSFKTGSDDLRESPFVRLAESLIGKGVPLRVFDADVTVGEVFGRNQAYVLERLPHIRQLIAPDFAEVVGASDVIVVGKPSPQLSLLPDLRRADQVVIDLVGMPELGDAWRPWVSVGSGASASTAVSVA